jgi:hypothetical protein
MYLETPDCKRAVSPCRVTPGVSVLFPAPVCFQEFILVFFVKRVGSHATTLNDISYRLLFRNRLGNRTECILSGRAEILLPPGVSFEIRLIRE